MASKKKARPKLPRYVRAHGPGFRGVVTVRSQRVTSQTFPTSEKAEEWVESMLRVRDAPEFAVTLTIKDGLALTLKHLEAGGGRDDTRDFYEGHAVPLFRWFGKERELARLAPGDVQDYVAHRLAAGVSPGTIAKKEVQLLRRMARLAAEAGCPVRADLFATLRIPKVRTVRFDYLTQQQVAEVVEAMRKDRRGHGKFWADVVELLFGTGIRRTELVRMRVADIDLERGRIFIRGKARDRHQTFGRALEPVLRRLIAAAPRDGRIVPSRDMVNYQFIRWRRTLGLRAFSPHVMRHSYGTAMAERVSQWQLMGLMDHADLKQTARYYHARGDDVRDALDGLRLDLPSTQQGQSGAAPAQE